MAQGGGCAPSTPGYHPVALPPGLRMLRTMSTPDIAAGQAGYAPGGGGARLPGAWSGAGSPRGLEGFRMPAAPGAGLLPGGAELAASAGLGAGGWLLGSPRALSSYPMVRPGPASLRVGPGRLLLPAAGWQLDCSDRGCCLPHQRLSWLGAAKPFACCWAAIRALLLPQP